MSENLPSPIRPTVTRDERRVSVRPGTWWRVKRDDALPGKKSVPAGTILLCTEVEIAHGAPHTVHLREAPASRTDEELQRRYGPSGWKLLFDELVQEFEPVAEAEALASRDAEIAALNGEIADIQRGIQTQQGDLQQIASSAPTSPTALLSADEGSTGADDATGRQALVSSMQEDLQARAAAITRVSSEIAAANEALQIRSARLATYYEERSIAASSIVKPLQAVANRLLEQVDTMGLYAGTNIEAQLVVDGPSAPASEVLHLFQRKLYLDEELLIHLLDGGADCEDVQVLVERLRTDPALVKRIFGAPRAAVLIQPRRNPKERITAGPIAEVIQAILREEADRVAFMLIRDGERIWHVALPDFLSNAPRLFPTPDDLDAPYRKRSWFRDEPGRTIGMDDLGYAKAVEDFRKVALLYERFLIMLWGLHDRLGVFGPIMQGTGYTNFGDPGFQQERFRLVMDDQSLIGPSRPAWHDYVEQQNRGLRPGSRVMAVWSRLVTPDIAPHVVSYDRDFRTQWKARFVDAISVATVRRDGAELVVDAEIVREVLDRQTHDYRDRWTKLKVPLNHPSQERRELRYLVLDGIDHADIDFYLESRSQRVDYLSYAAALIEVRNLLRAEAEEDAPVMEWLVSSVSEARVDRSASEIKKAALSAVRTWRASHKGDAPPHPGTPAFTKAREVLLAGVWNALGLDLHRDLIPEIRALVAQETGSAPHRISRDGKNRLIAYAPTNPQAVGRAAEMLGGAWPYVDRHVIDVRPDRRIAIKSTSRIQPIAGDPGETVIGEFGEAPGLTIRTTSNVLQTMLEELQSMFAVPAIRLCLDQPDEAEADRIARATRNTICTPSGSMLNRGHLVMPIGVRLRKFKETPEICVEAVCLTADPVDYLAGWQATRSHAINVLRRCAAHPQLHIDRLREPGERARFHLGYADLSPNLLGEWWANIERGRRIFDVDTVRVSYATETSHEALAKIIDCAVERPSQTRDVASGMSLWISPVMADRIQLHYAALAQKAAADTTSTDEVSAIDEPPTCLMES